MIDSRIIQEWQKLALSHQMNQAKGRKTLNWVGNDANTIRIAKRA
jgi:hypothetical protein